MWCNYDLKTYIPRTIYIVWVFKKVTFLAEGSEKQGIRRKINPNPTHSPLERGHPPTYKLAPPP
jgi:hypothetical protein